MPAGIRGNCLSGARGVLLINGQKVGWATSVEVGEPIDYRPVRVLDDVEVVDFAPVGYGPVTVDLATLTIVGKTLKSAGLFPKAGAEEGSHLLNILNLGELNLSVEDRKTGTVVFLVIGLVFPSQRFSIEAGNLSGTRVSGLARRVLDGSETA